MKINNHPSPFTLHLSPFTFHLSPFTVHRSLFTLHRSPFTVHRSPFTVHRSLFTLFILIFCVLFVSSCSTSTKPETGSLSGKVILVNDTGDPALDPIDYSGITVALYNLAYLDTTIVRINNQYPQIGVHINQETEFDHRYQQPVAKTITNTDGSFKLTEIISGEYNLVYFKSGWGIRYEYNIVVNKGENYIFDTNAQVQGQYKSSDIIYGSWKKNS